MTENKTYYSLGAVLIIGAMLALGLFFGCQPNGQSTLGNGQVDAVEAATLRVAVGLALTAQPAAVAPAYAVSTAVLEVLGGEGTAVPTSIIDRIIADKLTDLNLDPTTRQSFADLVELIKAQIAAQLGSDADLGNRVVVVRDVVEIVQQTAAARLNPAQ